MKTLRSLFAVVLLCSVVARAPGQGSAAGNVDASFDPGTGPSFDVYDVMVQSDRRIVIVGDFVTVRSSLRRGLARFNTDGTVDTLNASLQQNGVQGFTRHLLPLANDRFLVAGQFTRVNSVDGYTNVAIFNADGSHDTNFVCALASFVATYLYEKFGNIAVQADGKILLGSPILPGNGNSNLLTRLDTNGAVDAQFSIPILRVLTAVTAGANGNIYVAGHRTDSPTVGSVVRILPGGMVDTGFHSAVFTNDTGQQVEEVIKRLLVQPDGKILVCGSFTDVDDVQRGCLARLNTNGTLDASFVPASGGLGAIDTRNGNRDVQTISSMALQPDGRIVIGGFYLHRYGNSETLGMARVLANGSLDTGFDTDDGAVSSGGFYNGVRALALAPDGKVVAGGSFTNFNGITRNRIVRLNGGAVSKPVITTQPQSQSVTTSVDVTFTVVAGGVGPLKYQWSTNGKKIPGATNDTLNITNAQIKNAGIYLVTVKNAGGTATSLPALLTVDGVSVPDLTAPGFSVMSPKGAFVRVPSNEFHFAGTAKDKLGLRAVCYQQETNPWIQIDLTTNWFFDVTLAPGTNRFRLKVTDIAGNHSPTQKAVIFYVVTNFLTLKTNDMALGGITGATNGQGLEIGRGYSIKAKARSNTLFSNWVVTSDSGTIISTNPTLGFLMQTNLQACANFVTNPFIALAGQHSAIFSDFANAAWDNSGSINFLLTSGGTYSGKLFLGGATYSLSGAFDLALASKKVIKRKGTNELLVCLQLTEGTDLVSPGSVSNANFYSTLFGYHAGFSTKNPATNFTGRYTLLFSGGTNPAASPFGYSAGTATVANNGTFSFSGTLAEGTPLTFSTPLAASGALGVNVPLYKGKGSFFTSGLLAPGGASDINLAFAKWTKTTLTKGAFYRSGFSNDLALLAKRYLPPPAGTAALTFSNAIIRFEGANLTASLTNDVVLTTKNKVTVAAPNTNKLALTINAAKGTYTGDFKNPVTKKTSKIKGVLLQTTPDLGGGFCLGTNQSGTVYFGLPGNFPPFVP